MTKRAADILAVHASRLGIPSTVTFQVTDRCNYSCSHCYQEHTAKNELSTAEVMDVLEQLADAGVLFLTLMGGEFFMRPDANAILQKGHDLGFALKVLTTGHHIHDRRADFLQSIRPLQIDVSIYGAKPEAHEHITRQAGSWKRSFAAIERLVKRNISVCLKTPVMESNVAELVHIAELADKMGVHFTFDPKITAIEDGDLKTTELRMNEETLAGFYEKNMAAAVDRAYGLAKDRELRPSHETPCRAGKDLCSVNPQGEVWPCNSLPYPVGDLRKQSFASIWKTAPRLEEVRNLRWAELAECNTCTLRSYCNRCHGMALIEDGNIRGPSLEACRHAVAIRDSLRRRGEIPPLAKGEENTFPPTWNRVAADGQHDAVARRGHRSSLLKIIT